ncbi:MAG: hypothetical protein B6I18_00005 [Bacteroidetes bacterium 4572_112]|nr:MAG: hypothetical protein B6I18_00005 [Bacteroidetes bacterium 4572_112]
MKSIVIIVLGVIMSMSLMAQTSYYGMTSKGGVSDQGTIFKTDDTGSNLQTVFSFEYYTPGRGPKNIFTQASNGKIYGTTKFGGDNISSFPYYQYQMHSGVLFEYDPTTEDYNVLFNFDDTASGCWPEAAPVQAANGKLYGVVRSGGSSHNYGCVYSYDLATSTYTKIHAFLGTYASVGKDGTQPVGNLLIAADGNIYGITNGGGYNGQGTIYKIDPTTDTYTKLIDMRVSSSGANAGYSAESGLVQAANGKIYGTTQSGGSGYYGNIFEYDPVTNVAVSLHEFANDSLGVYPYGSLTLVGTNDLYCITYRHSTAPGASWPNVPHYYLWKYSISGGTATVVDSISNGNFIQEMAINSAGNIMITGHDYDISSALRFWEYNPNTNTRTLIDTSTAITFSEGIMQASNGKYYGGFSYIKPGDTYANSDGTFVEYDAATHTIDRKFNFSDPINGLQPEGDLLMASNGKFYGMTSKGGAYNKGVVFEFNPSNDSFIKKFDLDSLSGYEPKGGLMEASNGKLYGLTYRGGDNSFGTIFEIDTNTWALTKKADFSNATGIKPMGKMVEAWDGKLYGLTSNNGGTVFQFDITTSILTNKHSFTYNDGTYPQGSLSLADNGKLYGLTNYDGQSYYSKGTLFEYDPATSVFTMKKEMLNYTGYNSQGNTPLMGSDGKMYLVVSNGGNGNNEYSGGAIDEYIPGATTVSNKVSFSVSNTGSKPMGDLMESANGKMYGYAWIGGANNKGTIYEYNPATAILTKKVDFDGTNGSNPIHGSLKEFNSVAITISQQPSINSVCMGDTSYITIAASHATLLHYQWYKGSDIIYGATNDTLTFNGIAASDAGTYSCKITGGAKAVMSNSFTLTPANNPIVSIDNLSNEYCLNADDVNITTTPSGGVFAGTGISGNVFSASTAGVGSFDVLYTYTNAQACSNTDTVSITVNALPDASFSGYASTYCNNYEADTLIATQTGGAFSGNNGLTGNIFDPTTYPNGNWLFMYVKFKYTITDANACTNADSVYVNLYPTPTVTISGLDQAYCHNDDNDTATVIPTGGSFTGNILANNIYSPATVGVDTLIYTFTNSNQCTNVDTAIITVNALPTVSIDNVINAYCNNEADMQVLITPIGGLLTATSGLTGDIFSPSGANLGANSMTYSYTDANACSNLETVNFDVFEAPQVDLGSDKTICINHELTLDAGAGAGYMYNWSDGSSQQILILDVPALGVGTHDFSVEVQNTNCHESDTIEVTIEACTSIADDKNSIDVSIYPNPSTGKFYISTENNSIETVSMRVYSATGKIILEKSFESNLDNELVDLSNHPSGIYYLQINNSDGYIQKKLIVQ